MKITFACIYFSLFALIGLPRANAAAGNDNPYSSVVARNVFGLVPIPTGPAVDPTPKDPPIKIIPNGIMNLLGKVQVLFKVAGVARPGQPPKDQSYILSEGERQNDIEVVKIDEKAAMITFNNHGEVQNLSLVAASASGGGGILGPATGGPHAPQMPSGRPGLPGSVPPMVGGEPPINGSNIGGSQGANQNSSLQNITPEARIIMMEAQRAQWIKEGNPAAALIPPTPITPQVVGDGSANGGPPAP